MSVLRRISNFNSSNSSKNTSFNYPEKNHDPLRGHSKVNPKGINGLRGKSPRTTDPEGDGLVEVAPDAVVEVLPPRSVGTSLGRAPVADGGEPTAARNSGASGNSCPILIKAILLSSNDIPTCRQKPAACKTTRRSIYATNPCRIISRCSLRRYVNTSRTSAIR